MWFVAVVVVVAFCMFAFGMLLGSSVTTQAIAGREADAEDPYAGYVEQLRRKKLAEAEARVVDREQKIDELSGMLSICEAELGRVETELEVERRRRLRAELRAI